MARIATGERHPQSLQAVLADELVGDGNALVQILSVVSASTQYAYST